MITKHTIENFMDDKLRDNWDRAFILNHGYTIQHVSDKYNTINTDNIRDIVRDADEILQNIEKELQKEKPSEAFHARRESAIANMKTLREIILSAVEYFKDHP